MKFILIFSCLCIALNNAFKVNLKYKNEADPAVAPVTPSNQPATSATPAVPNSGATTPVTKPLPDGSTQEPKVTPTPKSDSKNPSSTTKETDAVKKPNKYEQIAVGMLEEFKEDKNKRYKKCTPIEWVKNNSTDIKSSAPKLKTTFDFLKREITKSLDDANLSKECSTPESILKVLEFLKKNLLGANTKKKTVKSDKSKGSITNAVAPNNLPVVPANIPLQKEGLNPASLPPNKNNPTTPTTAPTTAPTTTPATTPTTTPTTTPATTPPTTPTQTKLRRRKVKFIEIRNNRVLMKPFDSILKHISKLHEGCKVILGSPLFDRARFIINCIKFHNKKEKTKEDLQLTITNFTSNLYKLLDNGLDDFLERVVAIYCDKEKNFSKALNYFQSYTDEKDSLKKFKFLGQFFTRLIYALAK